MANPTLSAIGGDSFELINKILQKRGFAKTCIYMQLSTLEAAIASFVPK
jgi:hypothetical protein